MTLSDFKKQPRGPETFDTCVAKRTIKTALGDFTVELQMDIGDTPTDVMIRRADELVELLQAHSKTIHDKVFEHYRMAAEDVSWLDLCDVPEGLDRVGVLKHLQVRSLVVSREEDGDEEYSSRVYIVPEWDEEHAIYLAYSRGDWEFVDC